MKRILLLLCVFGTAFTAVHGQGSKVTSCWNYLNYYEQEGKVKDLEKAQEAIDLAVAHEKSSLMGKAWFFRGKTYYFMATNEEISSTSDQDLAGISFESFKKVLELDDKRFKETEQMWTYVIDLARLVFNNGITQYENQEFAKAYESFMKTVEVNNFIEANGKESLISSDDATGNAALAAKQAGMEDEMIKIYKQQMADGKADAALYTQMVKKFKELDREDEARELLAEGLEKYPSNLSLLIDELNFFIADGKLNEAIDKLDKALELDPGNSSLYMAKGNAQEEAKDFAAAKVSYSKAIELDPENFNAYNNLVAIYLIEANDMREEMDDLGVSPAEDKKYKELEAARKQIFKKVLPWVEKALEINPDNDELSRVKVQINNALSN